MNAKEMVDLGMTCAYSGVSEEIKEMTHNEMAVFIQAFADTAKAAQQEFEYTPTGENIAGCHQASTVLTALRDYRRLIGLRTLSLDYERLQNSSRLEKFAPGGQVYVIEFDDGSIKIGQSISAESRVKNIIGGNQAQALRTFYSARTQDYCKVESAAHREFATFRKGGEFFTTTFEDAVAFVEAQTKLGHSE